MTIKIAINGYGRIGRNILRAYYYKKKKYNNIKISAINDLGNIKVNSYLTKYDTIHGKFLEKVNFDNNHIIINNDYIPMFCYKNINELPWKKLNIDVVLECTGIFVSKKLAIQHIKNGAKKVIISAPGANDVDSTVVYGINENTITKNDLIISNSSCTTNCLAHMIHPLYKKIGLINGFITSVHSYTNDQVLIDTNQGDFRRSRSATHSIIPTNTGAVKSIGLIIPELLKKIDGNAIRVPTINVSFIEMSFISCFKTSKKEINSILKEASNLIYLKKILKYNTNPLVSIDFNNNSASCIFDSTLTKVLGNLVKISSWYDNEWGYCHRILDIVNVISKFI